MSNIHKKTKLSFLLTLLHYHIVSLSEDTVSIFLLTLVVPLMTEVFEEVVGAEDTVTSKAVEEVHKDIISELRIHVNNTNDSDILKKLREIANRLQEVNNNMAETAANHNWLDSIEKEWKA